MITPTYLITRDLVETLERKFNYPLTDEIKRDFRIIEKSFLSKFWKLFPTDLSNTSLAASTVSQNLENYFIGRSIPVISLDRVYLPNADDYLEITRLTDQKTGQVRISERSGKLKLENQLDYLSSKYKKINLADVGAFEGKTIIDVCAMLKARRIDVNEICLGIVGTEAKEKIEERFRLKTFNCFKFYEWIELRDLLGIDGRNVGVDDGRRLIMPYWENITQWASVPEQRSLDAEKLCKQFNMQIIGRLWQEGYDLNLLGVPVKFLGAKK